MPTQLTQPQHLALHDASHAFGEVRVLDHVSVDIAPRSFVAMVGPSGCGKTTILRMLGGLETLDEGSCSRAHGSTSFCFQEPRLLAWRTVLDNVALPLELAGEPRAARHARASLALALTQLNDAHARLPHQLSGGMKMRAALARALVSQPDTLLLDEPFSALDEVTRHELDAELRTLWERERFTAVLVTHSIPEAVFLAERVIVFSPRPARVVATFDTPIAPRDMQFWTSDALGTCARAVSEALLTSIAQARR